jgi:hypothetical protein
MANPADLRAEGTEAYASAALENSHQVAAVQSVLYGFDGRNTNSGAEAFIFVFDKATAPASGDTPRFVIEAGAAGVGGAGNFFYEGPTYGEKFKYGIFIGASSTDAPTYTALSSNKIFFHVQYASEDGVTNPA